MEILQFSDIISFEKRIIPFFLIKRVFENFKRYFRFYRIEYTSFTGPFKRNIHAIFPDLKKIKK